MDFVQHDIADIAARFFGYMVFILAYATIIHGAVQGVFKIFRVKLADTWWDDIAIAAISLFFAVSMDLNAMFYMAACTPHDYLSAQAAWRAADVLGGHIPPWLVFLAGNVVTAILVLLGRKGIVGIAEEFKKGLEAIKAIKDR